MAISLEERVTQLKEKRRALILAHNYQPGEVQDIADHTGDSLELARLAASAKADMIVFCGVHFMAETAAILAQGKPVYMPDANAGCPMANMVTPRELIEAKRKHPDAVVVTYVNSSAAIKALSDICCTSANAVQVVDSIQADRQILFVPDRNLGDYTAQKLGRELILWNGFCPTHERLIAEHVLMTQKANPGAITVAHPECRREVRALAHEVASTSGILRFCRESKASTFIIATEIGLLHRLRKENPAKTFLPASPVSDCPNMKLTTLEKLAWCLEDLSGQVTVPEDVAKQARRAVERMVEIKGG